MRREPRRAAFVEAHVEREHDPFRAELTEPGCDLVGLRDGDAADHRARRAEFEQALRDLPRADSAPDLDGVRPGAARDPADRIAVALGAVARTVEVDHVDPPRPEPEVLLEHVERVRRVDGLGVETTLQQAHAGPAPQVDGRNQQHQPSSRKLASTRAPGPAERSGWNCTPWKLPCRTAAENSPP